MSHQIITSDQLKTILDTLPAEPTEVTIVSRTEPAMRKTGNPFIGKLFKLSTVHGEINWHYAKEVNKQRNREGGFEFVDGVPTVKEVEKFEAHPRKWGTRLKDSPFVEHKGNFYLEMKVNDTQPPQYRDHNNRPVEGEQLEKAKKFFSKRSTSSRQGVEKKIVLRDYRFDRVTAITLHDRGMTFIVNNDTAEQTVSEAA